MRILTLFFVVVCLAIPPIYGQAKYRVGMCPGSEANYLILAKKVAALPVPDPKATRQQREEQLRRNDALLKKYLLTWTQDAKLRRYQVSIQYPDKKVWFWQSSGEKASFISASAASAAISRGDLAKDAKPGDNQRCFFQDTTVVLDTLRMRLGDFGPATRFAINVHQQTYSLPLNPRRTEVVLHAGVVPNLPTGRYLPATVTMNEEVHSVTLYVLSSADRAQLLRSLRAWASADPPSCAVLPSQLVAYLIQNWGGKHCANSTLYNTAQRQAVQQFLQAEHITCTP